MSFYLSQSLVFYILIIGVIPILLALRSYWWGRQGYAFLNRSNIEVLKGLSIVLIVFERVYTQCIATDFSSTVFFNSDLLWAALFLFVYGFETMSLYMCKRRYLRGFIFHRMIRIFCVFIGCNLLGALINIFMSGHDHLIGVIFQTLTFHFSSGSSAWLMGTLLYFYLAFYVSYRTKFKMSLLTWLSVVYIGVSFVAGWKVCIAFCFLAGVFTAKYKKYLFHLLRRYLSLLFIGSGVLFSISYSLYLKEFNFISFVIPYLFLGLVLCILMKLQLRSRLFSLLGKVSIEFYFIHDVLLVGLLGYSASKSGVLLILFVMLV
ncbi:MAG: hypothetical protein K2G70_06145, partial [Turicibacter sp.]|nr:hypothetical protein [Turicibacter sp.]